MVSHPRRCRGTPSAYVAIAAVSTAACTLLNPLGGLSSGGDAAPPERADVSDAGAPPPANDGGNDGGNDGDGSPPPSFCKLVTGAAICADFDDGVPPSPFTSVSLQGASNTLTYDDQDFKSAPRSLLMVGVHPPVGSTSVALNWKTPIITTKVVAEFDFKAVALGGDSFEVLKFSRSVSGSAYSLGLALTESAEFRLVYQVPTADGGYEAGSVKLSVPANGKWQHLSCRVTTDAESESKIDVIVDGVAAGSHANASYATLFLLAQPEVAIGDRALGFAPLNPKPWRVRFDNVVISVE